MPKLLVILAVGLTPRLLARTRALRALAEEGFVAPLRPVFPAVTCSVQATFLTGLPPQETGIVGNGWYFRELAEVKFWCQANALVSGEKVWEAARARDPACRTAQLFWWFNMYSSAELSVTPRPAYPADGRKIPDIYAEPPALRDALKSRLGAFPLFHFWGPTADIASTRWIVDAARHVMSEQKPNLTLVYLPHLDYELQRRGPEGRHAEVALQELDAEAGRLIDAGRALGYEPVVLSEYGLTAVRDAIHLNRALRAAGYLRIQLILDSWELLDCGASRAFAVADHQAAHVYVRDAADRAAVAALVARQDGVERVYVGAERRAIGLDHPRAGDIVAVAARDRWFSYYYWEDDRLAPDFARTVDIHRKPGYDPVELFLDPAKSLPRVRILAKLASKALGFRTMMDLIPLDTSLVRGSHGRLPDCDDEGPVLISPCRAATIERIEAVEVKSFLLSRLFAGPTP